MITDIELVNNVLSGCSKSSVLLFNKLEKHIKNICSKYKYRQHFTTDDLVQEIIINVFKHLHQYRNDNKIECWVGAIARNYCKGEYKKYKKDILTPLEDINKHWIGLGDFKHPNGLELLEHKDLLKSIHSLSNGYKNVLHNRCVLGHSVKQTANVLNRSESTVKTQFMKAKNKLRKKL